MNIEQTKTPELMIVEPKVLADNCGKKFRGSPRHPQNIPYFQSMGSLH